MTVSHSEQKSERSPALTPCRGHPVRSSSGPRGSREALITQFAWEEVQTAQMLRVLANDQQDSCRLTSFLTSTLSLLSQTEFSAAPRLQEERGPVEWWRTVSADLLIAHEND